MDAQLVIDHRHGIIAHFAGAHWVKHRAQVFSDPLLDLRRAADLRPGHQLALQALGKGVSRHQLAHHLKALYQGVQIVWVTEEVAFYSRLVPWVC